MLLYRNMDKGTDERVGQIWKDDKIGAYQKSSSAILQM